MVNSQSLELQAYETEVNVAISALPNDLITCVQAVGVQWEYAEGVSSDLFVPRVYRAAGYYSVLLDTAALLPPFLDGSIHETREESILRQEMTTKQRALVQYLPQILAGMDAQAPITTIVENITGNQPRWGNVARAVAEGRIY